MNRCFLLLVVCLFFPLLVSGQNWQDDYQQAQTFYAGENLDQAFNTAASALKKYQDAGGEANDNYAAILRLLSNICFGQSRFETGLGYIDQEIEIRKSKKDTTYAVALQNKAQFQEQMGTFEPAIATLLECKSVLMEYYKESELPILECDIRLGIDYYLQDSPAKANDLLTHVIEAAQQKNLYTEETLSAFYYAGLIRLESGNVPSSRPVFEAGRVAGDMNKLNGTVNYYLVLFGLGQACAKERMFDQAEASFQLALEGYSTTVGKDETYYSMAGNRAVNLLRLGNEVDANKLLKEIGAQPQGQSAYCMAAANFAALAHERKDFKTAESLYQDALQKFSPALKASNQYAEICENLAMLYSESGQEDDAFMRLTEAGVILERSAGVNSRQYAALLCKTGQVQMRRGNRDDASRALNQAYLTLTKLQITAFPEKVNILGSLADLELQKANFKDADSLYTAALALYTPGIFVDRSYLTILNNLAASKQMQGNVVEASTLVSKWLAETGFLEGKTGVLYANALATLAGMNLRLGDPTIGKIRLDSAMTILERTAGKESVEYALTLMDMGKYYEITGDYTAAEPFLKTARELLRVKKGEQSIEYANSLNALGILYQTLGNYRDAEPLLKESRSILEKTRGKNNAEYSTALQNLATLYQSQFKYELARPLLEEALEIDRRILGDNHPQYAITLQNLATLYQKSKNLTEAQGMLEKVLVVTGKSLGTSHPSYATTLSNLAALYQDQGKFKEAEATWKQSVELRKKLLGESHPDYARSLFGLAGVYHAQGQWEEARKYYTPVIASYLRQVNDFFPSLSEKEKSAFYAKIKPVFDAYQDFCIQYLIHHPERKQALLKEVYDLQLSTKAILLNATNKVRSTILASGDQHLIDLFKEWLRAKEEIVRYYNYTEEERKSMGRDATALEASANDLEKKLSEQSNAFHTQFDKEQITWKEVQKNLGPQEAAVEIIRIRKKYAGDSVYYVALILKNTGDAPELTLWPQGSTLETRRFKYHRNTIKFQMADTMSYKLFWEPLAERLEGVSTLYLSCDGVFNKVNFNSLYNTTTKRWVIDDFTVRQLSNSREIAERRATVPVSNVTASLFGFADFNLSGTNGKAAPGARRGGRAYGFDGEDIPVLPATEKEVDEVESALKAKQWKVTNLKKQDATEENLKKENSPRVVHIATHGFFLSDVDISDNEDELLSNPLFRSGVLLAGAAVDRAASSREDDGVLTAYEAMNLHLDQTDLVVLSACETGLGEVRNGEGVYGLQRSFLVAGANTVLMSLWQVDDVATQELMNTFYSIWLAGTDKHQAFRKAQLAMKEKYKAPYFWGAFVLIGY